MVSFNFITYKYNSQFYLLVRWTVLNSLLLKQYCCYHTAIVLDKTLRKMDDNGAFQRPPKSEYNGLKKYLGTVGRRPSAVQWRCLTSSLRRCRHDECPEPCEKIQQLQRDYPENQQQLYLLIPLNKDSTRCKNLKLPIVFKWVTAVFYGDHAGG